MEDKNQPQKWNIINCHTHVLPSEGLNSLLFTWPIPIPATTLLRCPFFRRLFLWLGGFAGWFLARFLGLDALENRWDRLVSFANMEFRIKEKEKSEISNLTTTKAIARSYAKANVRDDLYKKYAQYGVYGNITLHKHNQEDKKTKNKKIENEKNKLYKAYIKFQHLFDLLEGNYPPRKTQFVLLTMDTQYMFSDGKKFGNKVALNFEKQLAILEYLQLQYGDLILPFIHADPRRPNITQMVKDCINKHGFKGIKLYPPFGILPFDPRLDPIYDFALEQNVPIMAHCTPTGMIGYPYYDDQHGIYTDPENYKRLLEKDGGKYRELNLCLAHFGGNEEWTKYITEPREILETSRPTWGRKIIEMIDPSAGEPRYPNLYTDISFTSFDLHTLALLKIHLNSQNKRRLREKILFGSDYPVLQTEIVDRKFSINIRGYLGEEDFKQIAWENPSRWLGLA